MTNQQYTLVLPIKVNTNIFHSELNRIQRILLPSFVTFLKTEDVYEFILICKDDEMATVEAGVSAFKDRLKIRLLPESKFIPSTVLSHLRGWYIQQILKLAIAQYVKTDLYLLLDCDCFLTKPFAYDNLFCNNQIITNLSDWHWHHHEDWWEASLNIMNMSTSDIDQQKVITVTPQIMISNTVRDLIAHLDTASEGEGWQTYLSKRKFTEFTLYWLQLVKNKQTDQYYQDEKTTLLGNPFWGFEKKPLLYKLFKIIPKMFRPKFVLSKKHKTELKQHIQKTFSSNDGYYFSLVQSCVKFVSVDMIVKQLSQHFNSK